MENQNVQANNLTPTAKELDSYKNETHGLFFSQITCQ